MKSFLYKVSVNAVGLLGSFALMVALFPDLTTQLIITVLQWIR